MSGRRPRLSLIGQKVGQSGRLARSHDHDGHFDQPQLETHAAVAAIVALIAVWAAALSFSGSISSAGSGSFPPTMRPARSLQRGSASVVSTQAHHVSTTAAGPVQLGE
jgi:hypothetical protein